MTNKEKVGKPVQEQISEVYIPLNHMMNIILVEICFWRKRLTSMERGKMLRAREIRQAVRPTTTKPQLHALPWGWT